MPSELKATVLINHTGNEITVDLTSCGGATVYSKLDAMRLKVTACPLTLHLFRILFSPPLCPVLYILSSLLFSSSTSCGSPSLSLILLHLPFFPTHPHPSPPILLLYILLPEHLLQTFVSSSLLSCSPALLHLNAFLFIPPLVSSSLFK